MAGHDPTVEAFQGALLSLDRLAANRLLNDPGDPISPELRIERLVVPALEGIGREWEQGRVALSQVYMSGRICEDLVEAFLPAASIRRKDRPATAIAVLEDYHLLGKRMVYATLRASGFELMDLGRTDVESLVRRTLEERIRVLLISTLMLPSALRVAEVRDGLDRAGSGVKILVGGAPFRFDERLWREVGADAMGQSASDAVAAVATLSGVSP